jgi:FkbM family methyltransferase
VDQIIGHRNVKIVFEFGSRYGKDTIEFAKKYPKATIYGFECNTETLPKCKENTAQFPNIVLTEKAVSDVDGTLSFWPIDKEKTETTWEDGNQGASSLLKASGKY